MTSGILILDGKHIKVKGVKYYESLGLDPGLGLIGRCFRKGGESTWGYREIIRTVQEAGYQIKAVVSDGGTGIFSALRHFGIKKHQRCHVHLLRDLRTGLRMNNKRPKSVLRKFYCTRYAKLLLAANDEGLLTLRLKHFDRVISVMWPAYGEVEINAVKGFLNTLPLAFTFMDYGKFLDIPKTTNALEGYISHLNARLKTMRGLKNPANAGRILNAIHYFLRSKKD